MKWLLNCWYVAGWADELASEGRLARTLLDSPVLLWRDAGGRIGALADRCPHRFAPLSRGKMEGGTVSCGYHGLAFDGVTGQCVHNPHGPLLGSLSVRAYPVAELHKLLWIWMGDPARADKRTIPDLSFADASPVHAFSKGYMRAEADHHLLEDNILDLTHGDYLHAETLGGGSFTRTRAKVEERGNTVFVQWVARNEQPFPIFKPQLPDPDRLADMTTDVLWHPSGVMLLNSCISQAGAPPERAITSANAHIMTPETATSTHYFYCNSRSYRTDDADYNSAFAANLGVAFQTEDKPMIEDQQRRMGGIDLLDSRPALLPIDMAAVRARRIYRRLVDAESGDISPASQKSQ
jgi:phenylpropionate dioxygenase-like ring-hydroxylating dioxygenase large terminal subunit